MAMQAREVVASEKFLSVVADRGYLKSEEILACHDAGINAYVPNPDDLWSQSGWVFQ